MTRTVNAYRTPPQMERKAAQELRDAGIRAYVPTERVSHGKGTRRVPVARGYVFGESKPPEAKHVRGKIGVAPRVELIRLYKRHDVGHMPPDAFKPGDQVEIQRGPWAKLTGTVVSKRGRKGWWVDVAIFGRMTRAHLADNYMRKYDPG